MNPIPVAVVVALDECRRRLSETKARTHRGEVHKTREGNDPVVHSISYTAAVKLEERPILDVWTTELNIKPTKRPSANQVFNANTMLGTTLRALAHMKS